MKKILTIASILGLSVSLNAATISWAITSTAVTHPTTGLTMSGANAYYAQLIFLPTDNGLNTGTVLTVDEFTSKYGTGTYKDGMPDYGVGKVVGRAGVGNTSGSWSLDYGLKLNATDQVFAQNVTQFFIRIWSNDGLWYQDVSNNGLGWTNPNSEAEGAWTMPSVSPSLSSYVTNDWKPIPEPATMALVGIGIVAFGLHRRRK